jgi:hypothetical protein
MRAIDAIALALALASATTTPHHNATTHHQHEPQQQQQQHEHSSKHHPPPGRTHVSPAPPPLIPTNGSSPMVVFGTYDDPPDDGEDDEPITRDKEHLELDLWKELDIDEDRDEPILKVVVLSLALAAIFAFCRAHCCHRYQSLPSNDSLSPRRQAEIDLAFAPDFPARHAGQSPPRRFFRRRDSKDEEWSLDIFAEISRRLQL